MRGILCAEVSAFVDVFAASSVVSSPTDAELGIAGGFSTLTKQTLSTQITCDLAISFSGFATLANASMRCWQIGRWRFNS